MDVDALFDRLTAYQKRGYFLNPDEDFTKALIESLLVNEERYGYQACPCRLASSVRADDLDIICPCDYRDPDVNDFGACFCGLYVSKRMFETKGAIRSIPERRPPKEVRDKMAEEKKQADTAKDDDGQDSCDLDYPVWRCDVCGYLCARDEAPDICPICGVPKDRFSRFM